MISNISPQLKYGTARSLEPGSIVWPANFPQRDGPAILVRSDTRPFLLWPTDGFEVEGLDGDESLLHLDEETPFFLDERSSVNSRKDAIRYLPGLVLASEKAGLFLVIQWMRRDLAAVHIGTWVISPMPNDARIAFTSWSVRGAQTKNGIYDRVHFTSNVGNTASEDED